jgi:hypothetical protein
MSESEVIDIVVSQAEATSISEIASKIVTETKDFANRYGAALSFDPEKLEEDFIVFLTKHKKVDLTRLRVTVLEGGDVEFGDKIKGKRKADLIFRIVYKQQGGSRYQ